MNEPQVPYSGRSTELLGGGVVHRVHPPGPEPGVMFGGSAVAGFELPLDDRKIGLQSRPETRSDGQAGVISSRSMTLVRVKRKENGSGPPGKSPFALAISVGPEGS